MNTPINYSTLLFLAATLPTPAAVSYTARHVNNTTNQSIRYLDATAGTLVVGGQNHFGVAPTVANPAPPASVFQNDTATGTTAAYPLQQYFESGSFSMIYEFDEFVRSGTFRLDLAWQHSNWEIELLNSQGASFATEAVTLGNNSDRDAQERGVEFEVLGLNSAILSMNRLTSKAGDGFYGTFTVTSEGMYSGIRISQVHSSDRDTNATLTGIQNNFDSNARLYVSNLQATGIAVPEPSFISLIAFPTFFWISKRSRNNRRKS
ncbi:hypothetical protein [Roseibacillus ishigakijimensis]|uniref:PEP-CTERM protein-sorting domain-containing protein n=1 Tax=Roseibacillus ishigakijimensis TaxID=454146 RepID=A0A934RMZ8_9BACT|nr:hypothetical protein [Roseibacillus ishigakijimensis]MBK1834374.1 hypothetical protein [Roseibacillus ishigakijimensis]